MYVVRSSDEPDLVVVIQAHDEHVLGGAVQALTVLEEDAVCGALGTDVGYYGIVVPLNIIVKYRRIGLIRGVV